jgi:branched-chain amino acid transport system substrate-binding protein
VRVRSALLAGLAIVSVAVLPACDDSDDSQSDQVTVYSSLPLQGPSRPITEDIVKAERLALEMAGGKAGRFKVKLVSLDDSTAQAAQWDAAQTSANARKAAQDDSTVAYLGEYNSGATVLSVPFTNSAGIVQMPFSSYVGLTRKEGAEPGEPEKYYPSGPRNLVRLVPTDLIQAAAQVTYMKENDVRRVYLLDDKEVYGAGLADQVEMQGEPQGLEIVGRTSIDPKAANYRALAAGIAEAGADAVFFGGNPSSNAAQLWKDLHAADPQLKLFGPDVLSTTDFAGDIGPAETVTFLTNTALDPASYPPKGREFFKRFREKYGRDPDPLAIFGFETMGAVLDAIERAGDRGNDPAAVRDAVFAIRDRRSALGTYSIDRNGDVTLRDYGAYRIRNGRVEFSKVIRAETAEPGAGARSR